MNKTFFDIMEKITKEDLKALGIFYGTFNKRPEGLHYSEKLLTTDEAASYHNALAKITELWRQNRKKSQ